MAIIARATSGGGRRRRMLADINVVPYIDVMLVLVVILMVAAPFVNPSLVELPSIGKSNRAPDAPLEIIVKPDGKKLLRDRSPGAPPTGAENGADLPAVIAIVKTRQKANANLPVVISADKNVRYEEVTKVMDALYKSGVARVGLAVQPAP